MYTFKTTKKTTQVDKQQLDYLVKYLVQLQMLLVLERRTNSYTIVHKYMAYVSDIVYILAIVLC